MKLQRLLSLTRQAIEQYEMIAPNDRIMVGISGGKDSLTLLYALSHLQKFYPKPFSLYAVTVDLGLGMDYSGIYQVCEQLQVPYEVVKTDIYDIVFRFRKEPNPCSLCAKLRKGALNQKALDMGFHKIAYAHHRDDVIETFLMSLFYEGRLHTFSPVTSLERTGLSLLRPMIYVTEGQVAAFSRQMNLPIVKNLCPADGYTKRQEIKEYIQKMEQTYPDVKARLFSAIRQGILPGW